MLKTWSLFTASVIVSEFTAALFINGSFQQGYPKTLLDILKSTFGCCLIHNVSPQQVAPGVVFGWFFFPCWMPLLTQSQRNRTVDLCLLGECVNHYTIKLTSTKNHSWIRSLRFAAVQYQQCRVHPLQLTYNFTHQCCRQAVTRPLPSLVAEHINSSWQHWATCFKEFWEFSKAPVQQH